MLWFCEYAVPSRKVVSGTVSPRRVMRRIGMGLSARRAEGASLNRQVSDSPAAGYDHLRLGLPPARALKTAN
jgi:hypothetical protein